MAVQAQFAPLSLQPARRPSGPPARPIALHPSLLLREVAGESPDTETLRVRGKGMPDALLEAGDMILFQHETRPAEGELALLHLPGSRQARLRRIYTEGEMLRLVPESPRFESETLPASRVEIRGRVVAIMRRPR